MSEITVANTEASALESLRDTLRDVTISDAPVFDSVQVMVSEDASLEKQLHGPGPLAFLLFESLDEGRGVPGGVNAEALITLNLTIILAVRVAPDLDEMDRVTKLLWAHAAARNAIETDRATLTTALGVTSLGCAGGADDDDFHPGIRWESPDMSLTETVKEPWAVARVGLSVGYALESATAH